MLAKLRTRLTYANLMATVAMFVALGGTSVAAVTLKKNSVKGKHIASNAITSPKVKDRSLLAKDFKQGQLPAGPQGAKGDTGAPGAPGAPGADGTADAFARVQTDGTLQPNPAGFPPQNKGTILVSKGDAPNNVGNYCFDLPFRPASAMVSLDNADAAAADRNLVTSVAIDRGEDLGDCPANRNDARVRIVDGNTGTAQDARFFIWFEK